MFSTIARRVSAAIIAAGRCPTVVGLSFGMVLAAPALGANGKDWDDCQSKEPAVAIAACSIIIADESESPQNRADAYAYRAVQYLARGSFDRAIADYTAALNFTPGNITAYVSRALAELHEGDKNSAVIDYATAEQIDAGAVARIAAGNPEVKRIGEEAHAGPPPLDALGTSGGTETFPVALPGRVVKVPVTVNHASGIFILDTGASNVVLKDSFARKAGIDFDKSPSTHLFTANGVVNSKRGLASTIQLCSLKATGVPVFVEADRAAAYGADGLLGLSFLSRFNVTIDAHMVRIAARKPP
jgi:clan AA aspartic protease (TIGR02281 family)